MPTRAATLLLLPFLVCSTGGYAAPTASPASQLIVEAISGSPPLDSLSTSFGQLCLTSGASLAITSGLPGSFSELLPASGNASILITPDRADTEPGSLLLPLLATLILLFGMMALPIDSQPVRRPGSALSKKVQRLEVR
jgi:hypothetical protein